MKKWILFCLAICITLPLLASCKQPHVCEPSKRWRSDAEAHWHPCKDADCTVRSGQEAHVWGEGKRTKVATPTENGEMSFYCTVCDCKKTEAIEFSVPTEEDWIRMLDAENFINVTRCREETLADQDGTFIHVYLDQYTKTQLRHTFLAPAVQQTNVQSISSANRTEVWSFYESLLNFRDYEFDPEANVYRIRKEAQINCHGYPTTTSDATVTIKDGKLAKIEYTCTIYEVYRSREIRTVVTFTNYGTTTTDYDMLPLGSTK